MPQKLCHTDLIIERPVDHFPEVLKHFSDVRLIEMTCVYIHRANQESKPPWDNAVERAAMCRAECARRRLRLPCDTATPAYNAA